LTLIVAGVLVWTRYGGSAADAPTPKSPPATTSTTPAAPAGTVPTDDCGANPVDHDDRTFDDCAAAVDRHSPTTHGAPSSPEPPPPAAARAGGRQLGRAADMAPPALSNPATVTASNANNVLYLDPGTDYVVRLAEPITTSGGSPSAAATTWSSSR